jgi:hypothetical protein
VAHLSAKALDTLLFMGVTRPFPPLLQVPAPPARPWVAARRSTLRNRIILPSPVAVAAAPPTSPSLSFLTAAAGASATFVTAASSSPGDSWWPWSSPQPAGNGDVSRLLAIQATRGRTYLRCGLASTCTAASAGRMKLQTLCLCLTRAR